MLGRRRVFAVEPLGGRGESPAPQAGRGLLSWSRLPRPDPALRSPSPPVHPARGARPRRLPSDGLSDGAVRFGYLLGSGAKPATTFHPTPNGSTSL